VLGVRQEPHRHPAHPRTAKMAAPRLGPDNRVGFCSANAATRTDNFVSDPYWQLRAATPSELDPTNRTTTPRLNYTR
jgi:hypothetical protein